MSVINEYMQHADAGTLARRSVKTFPSFRMYRKAADAYYFMNLLRVCAGNMALAARVSKIGRPYLYHMIKKNELDQEAFRVYTPRKEDAVGVIEVDDSVDIQAIREQARSDARREMQEELERERQKIQKEERDKVREQLRDELERKGIIRGLQV